MKNYNMILTGKQQNISIISDEIDKYETLQINRYYLQIKEELENKLNLLILLYKKLFKNK